MKRYTLLTVWLLALTQSTAFSASPIVAPSPDEDAITFTNLKPEQCIQAALRNNLDLQLSELRHEQANLDVKGERGYREPAFVLESEYAENARQNTVEESLSQLTSIFEEENVRTSAGIEGLLDFGTRYRVGYDFYNLSNNLTNLNSNSAFDHQYLSFAGVTLTQPLLRGGGKLITESRLRNADLQREISAQQLRKQKMLTVANTELAYWNTWLAQEIMLLRAASRDNVKKLYVENQKRLEQGKMAKMEVEAASAGVAERESRWLEASTQWHETMGNLLDMMNLRPQNLELMMIETGIEPPGGASESFKLRMASATERHPDLAILKKETAVRNLEILVAENKGWMQFDLVGSLGLNGLGESASDSLDEIGDANYEKWSVGAVIRIPLGGGTQSKAAEARTRIEKRKTLLRLKSLETQIANRMRLNLKKSASLKQLLGEQAKVIAVNENGLKVENQLLDAGKSTSARVLLVEEDLLETREKLVRAKALHRKALIELDLSDGSLLYQHKLEQ